MSTLGSRSPRSPRGYRPVDPQPDESEMRSLDNNSQHRPSHSDDGGPEGLGISRRATEDFQRRYGNVEPPQWELQANPNELQTQFGAMNSEAKHYMVRKHSAKKQFFRLLWKILLRWLASFALSAGMMFTFYEYERVKILDKSQKRWFNALSTGLYLTLGLNLAGSFKGMATIVRWKLLSRKQHELEEIDFLLGLSSLVKVFHFGIHSFKRRPMQAFACFLWIFVNCIGRLSVALTGLTYSYDSADAFFSTPGEVAISDFSYFWPTANITGNIPELGAEYSTAHSWGLSSMLLGSVDTSSPHFDKFVHVLENQGQDWRYYFREYNPANQVISHKSNRYITVSSACEYFPVVKGQYGTEDQITYLNGTDEIEVEDIGHHAPGVTTWINLRSDLPVNARWNCGPRCAALAVIQFLPYNKSINLKKREDDDGDGDDDSENDGVDDDNGSGNGNSTRYGSFFTCTVNFSYVQNVKIAQHNFPDRMAIISGGAIGSEGYSNGPNTSWSSVGYYEGTTWGQNVGTDVKLIARLAGKFACGVVAARDLFGSSTVRAQGDKPWIGVLLKIKWPQTIAILGGILLAQLILGLITIMWSTTVICKDDSYLSTARLLRPLVERLGPNGCYLTGQEISNTFVGRMTYGVRSDSTGTRHHLDIGEDIKIQRHFPEGWYDGEEESMYPKKSSSSPSSSQETQPSLDVTEKTRDNNSRPRLRRRRIIKKARRGTSFI